MKAPRIAESPCKDDMTMYKNVVAEMVVEVIRERSATSQLISESEILNLLNDKHPLLQDTNKAGEDVALILGRLVHENEDLHQLTGAGSQCYYSSRYMTEAYAMILFHKLDSPMRLIAETVRQNSCIYQRPVLLDIFTKPPFDLAYDKALNYLAMMAATEGFNDIATTSTSASAIYIYSTSYLETEHAVMLAEWLDVGQYDNP